MKRISLILLTLLLFSSVSFAGDGFPNLELIGKLSAEQKTYLGVSSDTFKVSDIKAEYLFVEAYSMYCPVCQRDAPRIEEVYKEITAADTEGKIKFIGLALGNTPFEVEFYRKKYNVQFPLFMDEDYTVHKALGEIPTPTFYIVKMGANPEILYVKEGEAEDKMVLIKAIKDATGL